MKKTVSAIAVVALLLASCEEKPEVGPGGGKPSNPSTPDTPSAWVSKAKNVSSVAEFNSVGTLAPGDTVIWADGRYSGVNITFSGTGSADLPIVLRAATPGQVVFKGVSSLTLKGTHLEAYGFVFNELNTSSTKSFIYFDSSSSKCRVHDCMIDGTGSTENPDNKSHWVSMPGLENELYNCTFLDKRDMGLMVCGLPGDVPIRHKIYRNRFYRPFGFLTEGNSGVNGQEVIRIGTSDVSLKDACCEVYENYFHDVIGENGEIISNKSCKNVYYSNYFEYCYGALTLRHGNGCTVRGNYFLGGRSKYEGGVRVIGEDHTVEGNYFRDLTGSGIRSALCIMQGTENPELYEYYQVKNLLVKDNKFLNCAYSIYINYAGTGCVMPVTGVTMTGNCISASSSSAYTVYFVRPEEGGVTWTDNRIYGGRQSGTDLPTVSGAPVFPLFDTPARAIKANAGVCWER